jgi:hypothetical protein
MLRIFQLKTKWRPILALKVGGFLGKKMRKAGWGGCAIPLFLFTLILFWVEDLDEVLPQEMIKHEYHHEVQAKKGHLRWWYLYIKYLIKYGYENSPLEVEARKAELD